MLTSIHIQGFKGFKDTKIDGLRRVNLILGGQNSGKTSLLEAISLALGNKEIKQTLPRQFRKDVDQKLFWPSVLSQGKELSCGTAETTLGSMKWFYGEVTSIKTAGATAPYYENQQDRYYLELNRENISNDTGDLYECFPAWTPSANELMQAFRSIAEAREAEDKLIKQLSKIDNKIIDIRFSPPNDILIGFSNLSKRINIQLLGQGINRISYLIFKLLTSKAKICLIDELENGIHYSSFNTVWQGIANIARELDTQLFITTHSYECIQAAAKVFENTPEEFQMIRLERTEDSNIKAVLIRDEKLKIALDSNWEIR